MLLLIALVVAACFGLVVFRGAPYVPTRTVDIAEALDVARLKRGQTIVDLGSGDGRLLIAAAERGLNVVGYEINPLLVLVSRWRCRKYNSQVKVVMKDFWRTPLPGSTDCVFTFLAEPFMAKLSGHLKKEAVRLNKPLTLISYGFELPDAVPASRHKALIRYEIQP